MYNKSNNKERRSEEGETSTKHILVVEDDRVSILYLKELMNLLDIPGIELKTDHVFSGERALAHCRNHPCDLVLMDLKLPGMDGLEATRQLRKIKPFMPIIAQTAFALSGDEQKALEAGCNDYVAKPISEGDLVNKIKKYLTL